jgi:hypothetical protein
MVGVASHDCKCAVDLFGEDDPGQFMRQRHGAEGKQQVGGGSRVRRPAACRADGEDDGLPARVPLALEPGGEVFGGVGFAPGIEKNEQGRGSAPLAIDGGQQRFLGGEARCVGFGERLQAFEVDDGCGFVGFGAFAGYGQERELHLQGTDAGRCESVAGRRSALPFVSRAFTCISLSGESYPQNGRSGAVWPRIC